VWQGGKREETGSESHFHPSENDIPGAGSHFPSEKGWFSGSGKRASWEGRSFYGEGKSLSEQDHPAFPAREASFREGKAAGRGGKRAARGSFFQHLARHGESFSLGRVNTKCLQLLFKE